MKTVVACISAALLLTSCNGGRESHAEKSAPKKPVVATATQPSPAPQPAPSVDVRQQLTSISSAIPLYAGAAYRDDLTRRDSVMIRTQYGPNAEVYTMSTDDSYPQVYHYYVTYLAQFRGWQPQAPLPAEQNGRALEVPLNEAMKDPFIPGDTIPPSGKQVTLQVSENEAEPHTMIRYIVTPAPPAPVQTAQSILREDAG